ncbi:Asp-tRNA(Asn)/Glu-tRNA(Gln) amidotransferase subunit GatA [Cytophagaceae bacterium YF14B1]|uniref:Glutamyl-tRNA(Gln) amidotransferase subunit A n=1 Tax=Xanthocytophaga flava TaxID=3048013 RepID=A0AAE3UCL0_9BACT|nr:Asp-tRNA(Asn)/Glu-tRNA(Gln) amidotransferase subunit GatA [Xanthocytophaga flavus]MDJ1484909.1 Asp-tRNA(Asn)/Glu-tRNA(Gln) amidotransferase subunit GatA [Xanthocytophaga flavus]
MKRYNTLQEISSDIKSGIITCRQLVEYYLLNIENQKHLNAFVEVYTNEALLRADEIDTKISEGKAGRLAGMVMGLKDVLCYTGHRVQAGSNILEGFVSPYTATAVQRLLDEDAIIIGRQNCDEFAMGSSNESSAFGPVLNAADPTRVPGGSSGGSAVAVQADMCLASLGSDTGGSVRQPAAFCGIVGVKPTYGRISRYGLIAYASSFDCIGTFTRSVEDAALLLEIMSGKDEWDSTSSQTPVNAYSQQKETRQKYKIAYIRETIENDAIAPEIRETILKTLSWLKDNGHEIEAIDFPLLEYILPTYYILTTAEASSNLSRFDGVRYGYRTKDADSLDNLYKKTRSEGFGEEVKRRILLGTFVLSANYYDAYYTKAQRVRRLIQEKTKELFAEHDFILSPVAPTTAFKLGENTSDPLEMYLADIFSVQANVVGIPGISIPTGVDSQGLPIGIQIMSDFFEEDELLTFAKYLQKEAF